MGLSRICLPFAALAVLAGGCAANGGEQLPEASPMPQRAATLAMPANPAVTDQAAKRLCDLMRPQLSNWRTYTTSVGKTGLNMLVQQWAAQNGGLNLAVLKDRSIVDKATQSVCADVRDQTIKALEVPDLASALAGF
jgi:hypothetical protein